MTIPDGDQLPYAEALTACHYPNFRHWRNRKGECQYPNREEGFATHGFNLLLARGLLTHRINLPCSPILFSERYLAHSRI
jgi:hypothetical protein